MTQVPRKKYAALGLALGLALSGLGPAVAQVEPEEGPGPAWIAAADSLTRAGELETARRAYRELTFAHAGEAGLWIRIAIVELQLGRPGAALEAATTALDLAPDDPDTYLVLAQCEAASGDPQLGSKTLEAGLVRSPDDLSLLSSLAQVSVDLGEYARATGLLRQLLRLDPGNEGIRLDLIRLLTTSGDYPAAAREIAASVNAGGDEAILFGLLGKAQLLAGSVDDARTSFERALGQRRTAEALGGLGAIHFLDGDLGQAASVLREAIELDPADADLWFNLGNALSRAERPDEAEAAYRESLELDPRAASTHVNLGVLLLRRLEITGARRHLEAALRLDKTLAGPYLHLARIHAAAFRHAEALRNYREYADRVSDANESARIAGVIADLDAKRIAAEEARARGEIHLLQARLADRDAASAFVVRVRSGEDFYTLAAQLSEVAQVAGVDVGFVDPTSLGEDFRRPITALAVGNTTDPLPGPVGFFVFQRVE